MKAKITLVVFINLVFHFSSYSQTWIQQTSNTPQNLNGCFFVNDHTGWVVGDSGIILFTTNGGNTWTPQVSGVDNNLNAVDFIDSLTGYCVGKCGTVLKTINAGTTWTIQMQNSVFFCTNNPYAHELRTVAMGSATTGTAAGASGIGAVYTTNSFTNSTTPWYANFFHFQKVRNTNKVFTCTDQDIKITTDYGATWNIAQNYTSNVGSLKFGYYVDANNIFVCNGLAIFKYEWNGSAYVWAPKYTSTTFYINSLEFRNQQSGYFATSLGSIFHTINAGLNWSQQNTFISTPLNRLFFANDTAAWCVGNNGVILKYLNGSSCSVYDTITTHVTVYDTVHVSVTDTLIINLHLTGISPPNDNNTIKVYPNPTSDHLYINTGNYVNMNGYTLKITTALGQAVFQNIINQQIFNVDLATWGGNGTYFIEIINPSSVVVDTRKIILQ